MAADIRERRRHTRGEQLGASSRGGLDLTAIDAAIDSAATTALARHLPQKFEDALRREAGDGYLAALDQHLAALVHMTPGGTPLQGQDRRRPSVDCAETDATVKRLYVPSVEVQGYIVRCVSDGDGGELASSVREELLEYMGPDQRPLIVQELGASIALLSLWVPDVGRYPWSPTSIMDTHEGQRAHDSYYGVASGAQAPGFIDASQRNFQILPEISAAAAIETSEVPYNALTAVCQRPTPGQSSSRRWSHDSRTVLPASSPRSNSRASRHRSYQPPERLGNQLEWCFNPAYRAARAGGGRWGVHWIWLRAAPRERLRCLSGANAA